MATLIKFDGTQEEVKPKEGEKFSLEELQSLVGGYIEKVPSNDGRIIVINEEGKPLELPVNEKASLLYKYNSPDKIVDFILGDVVVCDKNETNG